jgi:hypothetical protein
METALLGKFWPLIHSLIQEILMITEPCIEEAAIRSDIPIELYYFSELGMESFSVEEFSLRDPFSNPEKFERLFARLDIKDWIAPARESGRYQVPEKARQAVRQIVRAGDDQLVKLALGELGAEADHERLLALLKQILLANNAAAEPPEKYAIANRFRVATRNSPVIVQIRECLMDLLAYHDDAHLSAARPYFNEAGIVWSAFGCVRRDHTVTADKIAEMLVFRGYEVEHYAAALQAAVEAGWLEQSGAPGTYRPTSKGRDMYAQVEKLTDEYFYRPWAMFSSAELNELYGLLEKLREQMHGVKKMA